MELDSALGFSSQPLAKKSNNANTTHKNIARHGYLGSKGWQQRLQRNAYPVSPGLSELNFSCMFHCLRMQYAGWEMRM